MSQYVYKHARPSASVDLVVFGVGEGETRVLLVRRKAEPFAGFWAIPGGFVGIEEAFDAAARREVEEETGLMAAALLGFVGVFGRPGRDPRGRTISIAHAMVVQAPLPEIEGDDDAEEAGWFPLDEASGLAFDHDEILAAARAWLEAGAVATDPPSYVFPFR